MGASLKGQQCRRRSGAGGCGANEMTRGEPGTLTRVTDAGQRAGGVPVGRSARKAAQPDAAAGGRLRVRIVRPPLGDRRRFGEPVTGRRGVLGKFEAFVAGFCHSHGRRGNRSVAIQRAPAGPVTRRRAPRSCCLPRMTLRSRARPRCRAVTAAAAVKERSPCRAADVACASLSRCSLRGSAAARPLVRGEQRQQGRQPGHGRRKALRSLRELHGSRDPLETIDAVTWSLWSLSASPRDLREETFRGHAGPANEPENEGGFFAEGSSVSRSRRPRWPALPCSCVIALGIHAAGNSVQVGTTGRSISMRRTTLFSALPALRPMHSPSRTNRRRVALGLALLAMAGSIVPRPCPCASRAYGSPGPVSMSACCAGLPGRGCGCCRRVNAARLVAPPHWKARDDQSHNSSCLCAPTCLCRSFGLVAVVPHSLDEGSGDCPMARDQAVPHSVRRPTLQNVMTAFDPSDALRPLHRCAQLSRASSCKHPHASRVSECRSGRFLRRRASFRGRASDAAECVDRGGGG